GLRGGRERGCARRSPPGPGRGL
ncbi:uncharacterized protein METZ01_LOCUS332561, partial [marine metagenome]